MSSNYINYESAIDLLSWEGSVAALRAGHLRPKAEIADIFLGPQTATLLNRAAFIDGLGYGVKAVTVMGENPAKGLPTVQGAMMVYEPDMGGLSAIIDSRLVTEIKTAKGKIIDSKFSASVEVISGTYQEEGLTYDKVPTELKHFIEESFYFVLIDAENEDKDHNLPVLVAKVNI